VEGVDREAVDSQIFAESVVGNAGSHAELIISDRDGDHGHTVRERLERGVEPGVGDHIFAPWSSAARNSIRYWRDDLGQS
jgi:hypothetical protein